MVDEIEPKYISIREFVDLGFLQEVNRLVLHPAGLALEVTVADDATSMRVWDYRDDPEGVVFGPGVIDRLKILGVVTEQQRHNDARAALFGDDGYDSMEATAVVQMPDELPGGIRMCQRCGQDIKGCDCPRFKGRKNMECRRCGALQGQHLLGFDIKDLVCPPPPAAED
jgi:hypothetical protein